MSYEHQTNSCLACLALALFLFPPPLIGDFCCTHFIIINYELPLEKQHYSHPGEKRPRGAPVSTVSRTFLTTQKTKTRTTANGAGVKHQHLTVTPLKLGCHALQTGLVPPARGRGKRAASPAWQIHPLGAHLTFASPTMLLPAHKTKVGALCHQPPAHPAGCRTCSGAPIPRGWSWKVSFFK